MTGQRSHKIEFNRILGSVDRYYSDKITRYGATAKGVDWNSRESQELRFEQLLKICDRGKPFSMNDYGCGYGALVGYMTDRGYEFEYCGYDISSQMIAKASELYGKFEQCKFFIDERELREADYTIASGIFNVRLQTKDEEWQEYVFATLDTMAKLSKIGFAFNLLTSYSDPHLMRSDLYYADPLSLFDYCKINYSRFVSLLHDYPLYEFTILVKKEGGI
jgi:SAM-dependent methyltransferase